MDSLTGIVHRVTYQNKENGYCVLKVKPSSDSQRQLFDREHDKEQTFTVTGNLQMIREGDTVDFGGEWKTHQKYGSFLDVKKFHIHPPKTTVGLKRFLATSRFKGIGEKTAEELVNTFGSDLPEIIENSPHKLTKLKGITKDKADSIKKVWLESTAERDTMIELQGIGLSPNLSQKLIDRYGQKAMMAVRENPYQLAQDIWGVGFGRADEIGQEIGFTIDHPERIRAGIRHALQQGMDNGHMFLPKGELVEESRKLLGVNIEHISKELDHLLHIQELLHDTETRNDAIYLRHYYQLEKDVAEQIMRIQHIDMSSSSLADFSKLKLSELFTKIEKEQGVDLASEQKEAVKSALTHPVSVMTGGPGTGKSTTINSLVTVLKDANKSVALTAPTGRAAKRMSEIAGVEAKTLHRLLKLRPGEAPEFSKANPLPHDMIIVDEASMLDIHMAYYLLHAVMIGSHILFVGDADQLPSVQAGNILADIIDSRRVPVTQLQTIFRQAEESAIIENAHLIKNGQFPELRDHPTDFYFSIKDDIVDASDEIVELVTQRIASQFGFDPLSDIQVLSPLYKTKAGVGELNLRIQDALNPKKRGTPEVNFGFQTFRVGDRVMQLKNNYEKDVFNGDVGFITDVSSTSDGIEMKVSFADLSVTRSVTYIGDEIRELTLAYAVSVHKSQGSEYPVVVMPVLTSHFIMLQRNLVYTGVTRAKKLVVLVGSKKAMFIALNNDKPQQRYSGLRSRLVASTGS